MATVAQARVGERNFKLTGSFPGFEFGVVIQNRYHNQGQQGGNQDSGNQRNSQAIEYRIVEDKKGAQHGSQGSQYDRFGTYGRSVDDGVFKPGSGFQVLFNKINQ